MAVYCKKCIKKYMELSEGDDCYNEWLVEEGDLCEGCGYDYLGGQDE